MPRDDEWEWMPEWDREWEALPITQRIARGPDGKLRIIRPWELPTHPKNYAQLAAQTERGLKELLRRQGWKTAKVPRHAWNAGGPDLIAYKREPNGSVRVRVLDNKATVDPNGRPRNVHSAGGLSARGLQAAVGSVADALNRSANPTDRAAAAILNGMAADAAAAITTGGPNATMPRRPDGAYVVTNVGGQPLTGVSPGLIAKGIDWIPSHLLEVLPAS